MRFMIFEKYSPSIASDYVHKDKSPHLGNDLIHEERPSEVPASFVLIEAVNDLLDLGCGEGKKTVLLTQIITCVGHSQKQLVTACRPTQINPEEPFWIMQNLYLS